MAKANFFIVAGNTAPGYSIQCLRNTTPISLVGCTVKVIIYNKSTRQVTNPTDQSASITNATSGVIEYVAETTDFPSKGKYVADIQVTYGDGGIEVLYNQAVWQVRNTGV